MRRPISADSAIMHPNEKIIALKGKLFLIRTGLFRNFLLLPPLTLLQPSVNYKSSTSKPRPKSSLIKPQRMSFSGNGSPTLPSVSSLRLPFSTGQSRTRLLHHRKFSTGMHLWLARRLSTTVLLLMRSGSFWLVSPGIPIHLDSKSRVRCNYTVKSGASVSRLKDMLRLLLS